MIYHKNNKYPTKTYTDIVAREKSDSMIKPKPVFAVPYSQSSKMSSQSPAVNSPAPRIETLDQQLSSQKRKRRTGKYFLVFGIYHKFYFS